MKRGGMKIGLLGKLRNSEFKGVEFDSFMFEAGSNAFTMNPKNGLNQLMQIVIKLNYCLKIWGIE